MKVVNPGESAGGENFRSLPGFDIGIVMRSNVPLSIESGPNCLSFNTTDDEKLARRKGSANERGVLQKRSERALDQFSPPTNDPAMWIAFDQSGKGEGGLAKVRLYRLQYDVGPRRELLQLCLLHFIAHNGNGREACYCLRDVPLYGAQPKRA